MPIRVKGEVRSVGACVCARVYVCSCMCARVYVCSCMCVRVRIYAYA